MSIERSGSSGSIYDSHSGSINANLRNEELDYTQKTIKTDLGGSDITFTDFQHEKMDDGSIVVKMKATFILNEQDSDQEVKFTIPKAKAETSKEQILGQDVPIPYKRKMIAFALKSYQGAINAGLIGDKGLKGLEEHKFVGGQNKIEAKSVKTGKVTYDLTPVDKVASRVNAAVILHNAISTPGGSYTPPPPLFGSATTTAHERAKEFYLHQAQNLKDDIPKNDTGTSPFDRIYKQTLNDLITNKDQLTKSMATNGIKKLEAAFNRTHNNADPNDSDRKVDDEKRTALTNILDSLAGLESPSRQRSASGPLPNAKFQTPTRTARADSAPVHGSSARVKGRNASDPPASGKIEMAPRNAQPTPKEQRVAPAQEEEGQAMMQPLGNAASISVEERVKQLSLFEENIKKLRNSSVFYDSTLSAMAEPNPPKGTEERLATNTETQLKLKKEIFKNCQNLFKGEGVKFNNLREFLDINTSERSQVINSKLSSIEKWVTAQMRNLNYAQVVESFEEDDYLPLPDEPPPGNKVKNDVLPSSSKLTIPKYLYPEEDDDDDENIPPPAIKPANLPPKAALPKVDPDFDDLELTTDMEILDDDDENIPPPAIKPANLPPKATLPKVDPDFDDLELTTDMEILDDEPEEGKKLSLKYLDDLSTYSDNIQKINSRITELEDSEIGQNDLNNQVTQLINRRNIQIDFIKMTYEEILDKQNSNDPVSKIDLKEFLKGDEDTLNQKLSQISEWAKEESAQLKVEGGRPFSPFES